MMKAIKDIESDESMNGKSLTIHDSLLLLLYLT
jgi:hypothetical protein